MSRIVNTAAAQMGPISKSETRRDTVKRLIALMREAKGRGAELVVFTELALTTFFPRWLIEDEAELDAWYETEMPGPETQALFDESKKLGVGFCLGYAELVQEGGRKRRFNTSILVDRSGNIVGKYRKVHLPGHSEPQPGRAHQHLEKRYFEPGNLGFGVWRAFDGVMGMCICNDRRWPETYRVMEPYVREAKAGKAVKMQMRRQYPAGPLREHWYHAQGCRNWIEVRRDTRTHVISGAILARDAGR